MHLFDPHESAGLDIAGLEHGNPKRQLLIGSEWVVPPGVDVEPGGTRDEAQHPVIPGRLRGEVPCPFESVSHQSVAQSDLDDLVEVGQGRLQFAHQVQVCRNVAHEPPWDERPSKQPVAGEPFIQSQQPFADAEAVRVGGREPCIIRDHAKIRYVVVQPLHLQKHDAKVTGASRDLDAGQGLEGLAIRECVPDRRVARDALGQLHPLRRCPSLE